VIELHFNVFTSNEYNPESAVLGISGVIDGGRFSLIWTQILEANPPHNFNAEEEAGQGKKLNHLGDSGTWAWETSHSKWDELLLFTTSSVVNYRMLAG